MANITVSAKTNTLLSATTDQLSKDALTSLGAVVDSQLSTTGGVSKVMQANANGDFTTGAFANDNIIFGPGGNMFMPDKRGVSWYNQAGTVRLASIYNWEDHSPQELVLESGNRIALGFRNTLQLGVNDSGTRFPFNMEMGAGAVSDAYPTKASGLISLRTVTQPTSDPASAVKGRISFQGVPISRTATTSRLKIWDGAVISNENGLGLGVSSGSGDVIGGTELAEFDSKGLFTAGTAPTFDTLAPADTVTHAVSKYKNIQVAKTTLNRATTAIAFSGTLYSGMRGVIYVTQDATGGRFVTLPTGSYKTTDFVLSTTAGAIDRLAWEYDGGNFYWWIAKGLTTTYDTDAQAFITQAAIVDFTQQTAINSLVLALKAASLWTRFDAIYPFVGGGAVAHSKDLKGTYNIVNVADAAWTSGVTHNSNGITGNATSGRGDTGISLNALGRVNSVSGYAYCKTVDITASSYLFGATDSYRFGISYASATNVGAQGVNDSGNNTIALSMDATNRYRGHHAINRSSATTQEMYYNAVTASSGNTGTVGAPTNEIQLLARKYGGPTYGGFSNANLAFAAFGQSLTSGEWTTFRGIIDTYQTALGRANP